MQRIVAAACLLGIVFLAYLAWALISKLGGRIEELEHKWTESTGTLASVTGQMEAQGRRIKELEGHFGNIAEIEQSRETTRKQEILIEQFGEAARKQERLIEQLGETARRQGELIVGLAPRVGTIVGYWGDWPDRKPSDRVSNLERSSGWLLCDGRRISKEDAPDLYPHLAGGTLPHITNAVFFDSSKEYKSFRFLIRASQ